MVSLLLAQDAKYLIKALKAPDNANKRLNSFHDFNAALFVELTTECVNCYIIASVPK